MLARRTEPMSFDEYLVWEAEQDEKWELVDGVPVLRSERWYRDPVTGMADATFGHNRIVANLLRHLNNRLAGGRCVALPSDLKVQTPKGNARYPDVVVECGAPAMTSLVAAEPTVLFEVLSPSNRPGQQMKLIADYQSMTSVQQVVFIDQFRVEVIVWTRRDGPWTVDEEASVSTTLPLRTLEIELPLSEIYEGFSFAVAPND